MVNSTEEIHIYARTPVELPDLSLSLLLLVLPRAFVSPPRVSTAPAALFASADLTDACSIIAVRDRMGTQD